MRADAKELHARQVALAQADLAADPDDDSKVARARRRLQAGVPDMLAPTTPSRPSRSRGQRARSATLIVTLVAISATIGAAGVVVATKTDVLDLTGITKADASVPPSPSPTPAVVGAPNLDPRDLPLTHAPSVDVQAIVDQVAADLAAQRQAEADAAAAAAAQQAQGGNGTTGGSTSSGGTTGGTTNGGGGTPPPPPPAAYVSSISFHATTGTGVINITANIQTTGSMSVGVSCTANGSSTSMSGPGSVDGPGSYSGSFTGLTAGTYSVSCAAGGVNSSSTNLTVY